MTTMLIAGFIIGLLVIFFKVICVGIYAGHAFIVGIREGIAEKSDPPPVQVSEKDLIKLKASERLNMDIPYYEADEMDALEESIEILYTKIGRLSMERDITTNDFDKLAIDEQINKYRLQAARQLKKLEKMKDRYLIK